MLNTVTLFESVVFFLGVDVFGEDQFVFGHHHKQNGHQVQYA